MSNSKVVLITGAAKRIGACIATTFHSRGYRVLIHVNESRKEGEKLALKLNQIREGCVGFKRGRIFKFIFYVFTNTIRVGI